MPSNVTTSANCTLYPQVLKRRPGERRSAWEEGLGTDQTPPHPDQPRSPPSRAAFRVTVETWCHRKKAPAASQAPPSLESQHNRGTRWQRQGPGPSKAASLGNGSAEQAFLFTRRCTMAFTGHHPGARHSRPASLSPHNTLLIQMARPTLQNERGCH